MNDNQQLDFLDLLNILSFVIGILNYQENLTQSDKQELLHKVDEDTQTAIQEIHNHLQMQDNKIDKIINILEDRNHA